MQATLIREQILSYLVKKKELQNEFAANKRYRSIPPLAPGDLPGGRRPDVAAGPGSETNVPG